MTDQPTPQTEAGRRPTTTAGLGLSGALRKPREMPDPEVDWDAWIADIEAQARTEALDVDALAEAFHRIDHPAVPNCELGEGATHPGVRYCVWKMERLAREYAAILAAKADR